MAHAKALFLPTLYLEPFGYVVIEAAFSGTPSITTNFGAFPETVLDHYTGFRCDTHDDFIWAAKNIDKIKPRTCRDWAMNNFTIDRVCSMYQHYFTRILNLTGKGWYSKVENASKDYRQRLIIKYPH
jgi:glycosyltransferase involved in cell wall biosynthesis